MSETIRILHGNRLINEVYLVDTDVISEARKGDRANAGVRAFFKDAARDNTALYLSVITIGELRQGVENIRRGDKPRPRVWNAG